MNYVHRDLKPSNILLNEKWQLVLSDFGTALQPAQLGCLEALNQPRLPKSASALVLPTQFQEDEDLVGTQDYMSPEAIQGKKSLIGFGSDLWTLGVIVW